MSHVKQHKTIIEITSCTMREAISILQKLNEQNIFKNNEFFEGQCKMNVFTSVNEADIETEIEEFENDNIKVTYTETQIIHTIKSKL